MKQATSENFEELMDSDKPVIIDFWASWCGPCNWLAPVFEKMDKEFGDKVVFAKCNVDEQKELAQKFGIRGIPAIIFLKDGKEVDRITGFVPEEELKPKIIDHMSR